MADLAQFVVNNTEYDIADDTKVPYDLLQDTVGFTSKNLIPFPYNDGYSKTSSGMTFTVNSDCSVTINGTATGSIGFTFVNNLKLEQQDYIYSSKNTFSITGSGSLYINAYDANGTQHSNICNIMNNQKEKTLSASNVIYDHYSIGIWINSGATVNNVTVYPMLRKADIMDSTYEQYRKPVPQYIEDRIKGTVGFSGKNLLPYPSFTQNTVTINGITFTNNHDGSVTVSGTNDNTSASNYTLINQSVVPEFWNGLKNIPLILSGGISAGVCVLFWGANSGTIKDIGNEANIVFDDSALSGNRNIAVSVAKGVSISSPITVYPMVRLAEDLSSTYEPYHIPGVVSQEAQNILGAKNLLPYPFRETTLTRNGITFTDNGDGSITMNGTSTQGMGMELFGNTKIYNDMSFKLSGCFGGSSTTYWLALRIGKDSDDSFVASLNEYNNEDFIYQAGFAKNDEHMRLIVHVEGGVTLNNVKLWPMMRLLSVNDNTYVPYAKTNRELTEETTYQQLANPNWTTNVLGLEFGDNFKNKISDCSFRVQKFGHLIQIISDSKFTEAIETGAWENGVFVKNLPKPIGGTAIIGILGCIGTPDTICGLQINVRNSVPQLEFVKNYTIPAETRIKAQIIYICE